MRRIFKCLDPLLGRPSKSTSKGKHFAKHSVLIMWHSRKLQSGHAKKNKVFGPRSVRSNARPWCVPLGGWLNFLSLSPHPEHGPEQQLPDTQKALCFAPAPSFHFLDNHGMRGLTMSLPTLPGEMKMPILKAPKARTDTSFTIPNHKYKTVPPDIWRSLLLLSVIMSE